ncbi:MAG: thymidylate synthase [Lachnospiraceae bacterium]|nr:thymidylate synthase [Lachnospiraceae bacterium]
MSAADRLFIDNINNILENGISDENMEVRPRWEDDNSPAHTLAVFGAVDRYDLSKEFPIMTLKRTFWKSALDEIFWIWQKKSNNVNELSSHVWDAWADEKGSIGKAYGYQMSVRSEYKDVTKEGLEKAFPGGRFRADDSEYVSEKRGQISKKSEKGIWTLDQTDRIIYQLVNDPGSRRIMSMMYIPQDLSEMALAPCAYSMTFNVMDGRLNGMLNQRSQDMAVANSWNTVQAALLVYAFASAYGFEPGELVHVIANCHLYDRHIEPVKELIKNPQHDAPKLQINPDIHDFYDFTKDDFSLPGYKYSEFDFKFPVAV